MLARIEPLSLFGSVVAAADDRGELRTGSNMATR
jgi:hypothetical protein